MATVASELAISALPTKVGQSIPLDTPHVQYRGHLKAWNQNLITHPGRQCIFANMGSLCRLREGGGLGCHEHEECISQVVRSLSSISNELLTALQT